jgi:hypothetical protein
MELKIVTLRRMIAANDWTAAIKFAAKFPRLGDARDAILSAKDALQNPAFYRQLRRDPDAVVAAGVVALVQQYQERA